MISTAEIHVKVVCNLADDKMTTYIMDKKDFLSGQDFSQILHHMPRKEEWRQAVVYNRRSGENIINPKIRHAYKIREINPANCRLWQSMCTRRLVSILREELKNFHYVFARPVGIEWLHYEPGMFFRPHQDFERYTCNGMIPYVLLLGMCDVEEGGETLVGETVCSGSIKRNGAVFFPSNMVHEARPVIRGIKCCLKLEYFVFVDEDPIVVSSHTGDWKSFWTQPAIAMVDNYIRSHLDFKGENHVRVSTSMAQGISSLMRSIAHPMPHRPISSFDDMIFPNLSIHALHDLFTTISSESIILGKDPHAWEILQQASPTSITSVCLVGLWARNDHDDKYRLRLLVDRMGRCLSYMNKKVWRSPPMQEDLDGSHFMSYPCLRERLIQKFIISEDFPKESSVYDKESIAQTDLKKGTVSPSWETIQSILSASWKELLKVQPAQTKIVHENSRRIAGEINKEEREWCNDEESGFETVRWKEYVSFQIQTRWVRIRMNGSP
jgi:hypothetical protein